MGIYSVCSAAEAPVGPPSYPGDSEVKVQESLTVQLPQLQLVCQLQDGSQQVPVLVARTALYSDIHNWSSQVFTYNLRFKFKVYLCGELQLEVVYYNEKLSTWEPLLEPVMESEGNYRPWEILFKTSCLLPPTEGDVRSSCHGTMSASSSSAEDTDQETGMTVIRKHAQPRARRQPSVKSHGTSSFWP
ncbi:hypothetical protein LAZ67_2003683 [Cordylochernes scorpioides]|uniref:Uncharacterized protein n=1 Tax=Cordylochernes scorpioides TaxID=51811 RepID=A0ABY6K3Y8_9ARAC|nr:hypothetical protein LAZ67_2003683 [Cordylochernes scorpioides]